MRRTDAWQDRLYVTTILALAYFLFLRKWPLSEDQAIYHYMAWAVRHGLVLYRDVINMNWPGCVLVHMLAQSLMGMDAQGVRLVEVVFLGVQGFATAAILRAYGVGLPFRIAAFTSFLIAYFDAGFDQTAQRESFMTACLAVALVPLLTARAAAMPPGSSPAPSLRSGARSSPPWGSRWPARRSSP